MFSNTLITLLSVMSVVTAAALHPIRQASPLESFVAQQECSPTTVYSYLTVTVTNIPATVTIAVPNYASISSSLASDRTIESIVVVENSQNRPVEAPPNTVIPTFVHTVSAIAVAATEITNGGNSVVFLPVTSTYYSVPIETTTDSIIVGPYGIAATTQPLAQVSPLQNQNFTVPAGGWHGTGTNATAISPAAGTGPTAMQSFSSTVTQVTYVSTTTYELNSTITSVSSFSSASQYSDSSYGGWSEYSEDSGNVKRQTCVMVSVPGFGQWCNDWSGFSAFSYTTWSTTVTPGVVQSPSRGAQPTSPIPDNISSMASSTLAAPSTNPSCGQVGTFVINFDNLPTQSVDNPAEAKLPPIINPYEHLFWAPDWSYVPPPSDPYPPHSGDLLAVYVPPAQNVVFPDGNLQDLPVGGFGAAQRSPINAYWFDVNSAWIGCTNNVTDSQMDLCEIYAQGYVFDEETNTTQVAPGANAYYTQQLCESATCQLQKIFLPAAFANLSTVSFYAKIGASLATFYMDDIELTWSNNTCEAGLLRAEMKK